MTDLIIIGAGPGGYETAVAAAKRGLSVVIIEARKPGGTCLNEGCIPTKCLCRSAEVLDSAREAGAFGVSAADVSFSLSDAVARKDEVVRTLIGGVEQLMKLPGITYVEGRARFLSAKSVEVAKADGTTETFEAQNVIIATGSVSKFLPIEGAHSRDVLTSTEMLELQEVPRRLCVIGGGVIGLEFASIFSSFGSEVSVVEYCKEVLPNLDRDVAKRLRTALKKRGISFYVDAAATAIRPLDGGGSTVCFSSKGKEQSIEADVVLMAVGRAANVGSLNLADAGIDFSPRGITVDEHLQTSVAGVYAIGDVNGLCPLAHAASFQGKAVLDHIQGSTLPPIDLKLVPSAVFTVPELASVGLSEEACKAEGISYATRKALYRANGKALSMGEPEGLVKLLIAADGRLLGAHILGAHAADLVHEATLAMSLGATAEQLARTIHAHPTLSELVLAAAE